jgi:hypothetical protein
MNQRRIVEGALLGAVGGMAMAMWSMIALAATGAGFFAPVNLIAHSVWHDAPLDGTFSAGALLLGLVIHMMISMMLGVVIVELAARPSFGWGARVGIAVGVPMAAWAGQLVIWEVLDSTARAAFTPWVLFVGHLMFGMIAAFWIVMAERSAHQAHASTHVAA